MQTHEWEELLDGWVHDKQSDTLLGSRVRSTQIRKQEQAAPEAVAEVIRLRKAIATMRDRHLARIAAAEYITADLMTAQFTADDLTRILEGDTE